MHSNTLDIAQTAARLIVEDGLDYSSAKRQAVKILGLSIRTALPDNDEVEEQVREHIAIFHAETQPLELLLLRKQAITWMSRMLDFRPHLTGAAWNGTATRHSDLYIQLFCDDPKSAEITLIDHNIRYDATTISGMRGKPVDALSLLDTNQDLQTQTLIHLMIYDHDDLRGAMKPNSQGKPPRGDIHAVRKLIEATA